MAHNAIKLLMNEQLYKQFREACLFRARNQLAVN